MPADFQTVSSNYSAPVASLAVTKPSGTVAGDYLLAIQFMDPDTASSVMTASGFTQAGSTYTGGSGAGYCKVWTKFAGGSEPTSYTFGTGTTSDNAIFILRISGVDTAGPIDAGPSFASGATATGHVAPSIAGTDTGLLVCAFSNLNIGAAGTSYSAVPAPLTERAEQPATGGYLHAMIATGAYSGSAATGTKSATFSTNKPWNAVSIMVAPAVATVPVFVSQYSSYH